MRSNFDGLRPDITSTGEDGEESLDVMEGFGS